MLLLLLALAAGPPVAKKEPVVTQLHGRTLTDDYAWLRQKGTPEVEAHLRAENAWADEQMKHTLPLQESLYKEMVGRIQETDVTVPYRRHGWLYFTRTESGKEQSIFCRKRVDGSGEMVVIDLNAARGGGAFVSLGTLDVSMDGNLMAYTLDRSGFRDYELHVEDLRTKKALPDTAKHVSSVEWAADHKTLFYVVEDEAKRPYRLVKHPLGLKPTVVYEEKDERFDLSISRSSDEAQLILNIGSATTNEARALDARTPNGKWRVVLARKEGREGDIDHGGASFFVRVNDTGRNFRFVQADASLAEGAWKELIPHRDDVMLDEVLLFEQHYVAFERQNALPRVRVIDRDSGASSTMTFDEPVFSVWPEANWEYASRTFRYGYASMVTPPSVYDRSMDTGAATLLKRESVLGGYDPSKYVEERLWVAAPDGVRVPVSIAYAKGRAKDGKGALLLEVYGAYGSSNDVGFSSERVSLLDRGVALAIAHVRGGGELGKPWHDAGRMLHKRNTFSDLVAVAEALEKQGYASKQRLVLEGASAGGLSVGAAVNARPDLFKAVLALVPFVDVINTMLDTSLPLTAGELEEWGNPKVKEQGEYMLSYSPYDNVEKKAYPAMLVRSAYNDSQVMYWEPAKWVAKLRALKTDSNPLLLKVDLDPAGHGGKSGRYEQLREEAYDLAFALWQMGLSK